MTIVKRYLIVFVILLACFVSQLPSLLYPDTGMGTKIFGKGVVVSQNESLSETSPEAMINNSKVEKSDIMPRVDKSLSELILANKSVRLSANYTPEELISIHGVRLQEVAATALTKMLSAMEQEGIHGLVPYSGYRSYDTQAVVYNNKIASLRSQYKEAAEENAQRVVAPPGASEHQTGLAIDFTLEKFLSYEYVLNYDFADTEQGQWLRKNSWKYGFILRYDESKESETNIVYEPWHFRYVGLEHAKRIYEGNLCLEEYLNM